MQKHQSEKVKTYCLGLSSETKNAQFFSYDNYCELSSIYSYGEHKEKPTVIDVKLVKGDQFLKEIGCDQIDFYKFFEKNNFVIGKIYSKSVDFRAYAFEHEDFIGPNFIAVHKDDIEAINLLK